MKYLFILIMTLKPFIIFSQQITYADWKEQAKSNIRLIPEYGNVPKSEEQKKADQEFIERALKLDTTKQNASRHMIELGFEYLNRGDVKTAMYRFNQAWLLYPANEDAYWGYGAIYFTFTDYESALKMYDKGLSINPNSSKILTDKATIYEAMLYDKFDSSTLKTALTLFKKSYSIDPNNHNTTYKLSTLYFYLGDCKPAIKYYNECKKSGGQPITEEYTKALKEKCNY